MISPRIRLAIVGTLLCISVAVLLVIFGKKTTSCILYSGSDASPCPAELENALLYVESLDASDSTSSSTCAALHYTIVVPVSDISGAHMNGTCTWKTATKILGYAGVISAFLFFLVSTILELIKPEAFEPMRRFLWVGGALSTLVLGAAYILMIIDIVNGQGYREDYFVPLQEQTIPNSLRITSTCLAFIMTFIVTVASLVILGTTACWSFKNYKRELMASELSEVIYAKR